ncbi:MAG: putative amino acid dehydrogenase, partial [bacterium]
SISLGSSSKNYDFKTTFLGEEFHVIRLGADQDEKRAEELIQLWEPKADVIGLGMVRDHYSVGTRNFIQKRTKQLEEKVTSIPVTTGITIRGILQEWAIRHVQEELGNYFNNSKILFLSGMTNYRLASVMAEYSDNLSFADPILQFGIPKLLTSQKALELYAAGTHPLIKWNPSNVLHPSIAPIKEWNHFILRQAMKKATVVVASNFQLEKYTLEELAGKTVLTSAVNDEMLEDLADKGVGLVIDSCPKIFDRVVGRNVLEAMIIAALGKDPSEITYDDYLEIITDLKLEPRVLYPNGESRVNLFAFVIHPLSQEYFKQIKPIEVLSHFAPPVFMGAIEKAMAYAPPFVYSKIEGVKSPTGVEAEGWLISVGGTPKEILSHSPEFTYRRLLSAADMAKKMGAQIMGLGAFTKVVGDAGITVAKRAPLPITTGNSYSASGALWAAHDAIDRMGLIKIEKGKKIKGKAMVVGATGAIGSVCARLLAKSVDELYIVSPETAKLLAIKESIERETPDAKLHLSSFANKNLDEMDMIVTATSGAGKKILDIMDVKPGCVITDVARPLDLPASEVAKRPDVLVIESGEIELPGDNVRMKNIGLPEGVVYACLAETIVLALEGQFENFTLGRNIEWEKVKEIYKLGLKHGMKLAAISGVNGIFSDEDIAKVRDLAIKKRAELEEQASAKTA